MNKNYVAGLCSALCLFLSACGDPSVPESAIELCSTTDTTEELSSPIHPLSMASNVRRFLVKKIKSSSAEFSAHTVSQPINHEWQVVVVKDGVDPNLVLQQLTARADVLAIEPDFEIEARSVAPTDPGFKRQWAHQKVNSLAAWDLSRGSERVVVAVIDGGVEHTHPDLAANIWHNPREVPNGKDDDRNGYVDDEVGWDFLEGDNNPKSDASEHIHGTHVAGIIGAVGNNGQGVVGHVPNVSLMALKYIGAGGTGLTSDAIKAIDYAVQNGAHIINVSWSSANFSQALYDSIQRARTAGVLVVAASGNDSLNIDLTPRYPAAFKLDNIVSVGASTNKDGLASFSNSGPRSVDIVAPGTAIYSTRNGAAYSMLGGTSMATPLISAVAALIKARHPQFTYQKLAAAMFLGVDRLPQLTNKIRFGGRVNAFKALRAADDLADGRKVMPAAFCPPS